MIYANDDGRVSSAINMQDKEKELSECHKQDSTKKTEKNDLADSIFKRQIARELR